MASLTLHNIPQHILDALEKRAQANQSSPEVEVLELLSHSLESKSNFGSALREFMAEPFEHEEPYVDPFEDVRDTSLGREVDL